MDPDEATYCKVYWPWEDVTPSSKMEVLVIPKTASSNERCHMLIEGLSNTFCDITTKLSNNSHSENPKLTEQGFNKELVCAYRELGNLLQYMVNCTSYHKDSVQSYDYYELERRLDVVKLYLRAAMD
jgi:hypothetical protein